MWNNYKNLWSQLSTGTGNLARSAGSWTARQGKSAWSWVARLKKKIWTGTKRRGGRILNTSRVVGKDAWERIDRTTYGARWSKLASDATDPTQPPLKPVVKLIGFTLLHLLAIGAFLTSLIEFGWIGALITVLIGAAIMWIWRRKNENQQAQSDAQDDSQISDWRYVSAVKFRLLYIPFFVLLQTLFWVFVFFLLVGALQAATDLTPVVSWLVLLGVTAISFSVSLPKLGASFTVPNMHVAVLTIFGQRVNLFLLEGNYPDFRSNWILGISTEELPGEGEQGTTLTASGGFVNLGRIPVMIWNDRQSKKPKLTNIARNGAAVGANLLIELQVTNPNKLLNSGDPLLSIAERARTAFRTAISFFIDRDNATVKTILVKLMMGNTIITSFVNSKTAKKFEQGMIVRDAGGRAMIEPVAEGPEEEEKSRIEEAKRKFRDKLGDEADETLLEMVPTKRDGDRVVYDMSVEDSLDEVLAANGCKLTSASVSNIEFSDPVAAAADAASSEAFQARKMLDSAQAQADSEATLAAARKDGRAPVDDLDRILVAGQDNERIEIKHISSSGKPSELVKAAGVIADSRKEK